VQYESKEDLAGNTVLMPNAQIIALTPYFRRRIFDSLRIICNLKFLVFRMSTAAPFAARHQHGALKLRMGAKKEALREKRFCTGTPPLLAHFRKQMEGWTESVQDLVYARKHRKERRPKTSSEN